MEKSVYKTNCILLKNVEIIWLYEDEAGKGSPKPILMF